jgi:prophage DNA circulation protein
MPRPPLVLVDRLLADVNRAEAHLTTSHSAAPWAYWSALNAWVEPSPASPVVEALQVIEEAAAAIEVGGQGALNQVKTITAGLTAISHAVDRTADVRAAALDTRRLLRQALTKLRDRVGARQSGLRRGSTGARGRRRAEAEAWAPEILRPLSPFRPPMYD